MTLKHKIHHIGNKCEYKMGVLNSSAFLCNTYSSFLWNILESASELLK